MNDHARELRRYAPLLGRPTMMLAAADEIERLAAKLEAAEKSDAESLAMYRKARDERDELRAKLERMEKQEPVAWGAFYFGGKLNGKLYSQCDTEAQIDMYIADRHQSDDSNTFQKAPLYALPGAKGEEK